MADGTPMKIDGGVHTLTVAHDAYDGWVAVLAFLASGTPGFGWTCAVESADFTGDAELTHVAPRSGDSDVIHGFALSAEASTRLFPIQIDPAGVVRIHVY